MADFSPVWLSLGLGTSYKTKKESAKLQGCHISSCSWHGHGSGREGVGIRGTRRLKGEVPPPTPSRFSTEGYKNK